MLRSLAIVVVACGTLCCSKSDGKISQKIAADNANVHYAKRREAAQQEVVTPPSVAPSTADRNRPMAPLRIAISSARSWVAWDIATKKHWFTSEGVSVDFKWFEYVSSLEAFGAGVVDAIATTNLDALVLASTGAPSISILANANGTSTDRVVARSGITKVHQLKGKRVGVELGFAGHLLLAQALQYNALEEKHIQLIDVPTEQAEQELARRTVDAIAIWRQQGSEAQTGVSGAHTLFTSATFPGTVYDLLALKPKSLSSRRKDWLKVARVWFRVAAFLKDPDNLAEATAIISARINLKPSATQRFLLGTAFLDRQGNFTAFSRGAIQGSVWHSSRVANNFHVTNQAYPKSLPVDTYFDDSIVNELVKD